jgi:DNA-binding protein HU-beta
MNRQELIDSVAEKAGTTKAAAGRMLEAIFDSAGGAISEAVQKGKEVSIPGFGKFRSKVRKARRGRNPRTGAEIEIPETTVIAFSPGKGLRDALGEKSGGGARKAAGGTRKPAGGAKKGSAAGAGKASPGGAKKGSAAGARKPAAAAKKSSGAGAGKASTGGAKKR